MDSKLLTYGIKDNDGILLKFIVDLENNKIYLFPFNIDSETIANLIKPLDIQNLIDLMILVKNNEITKIFAYNSGLINKYHIKHSGNEIKKATTQLKKGILGNTINYLKAA